ncbi:MAG: CoA ester lyase [Alphaproteobacteria bacterium]|nr:CoA ester lyase [Alphaproteobacteria bacterium]
MSKASNRPLRAVLFVPATNSRALEKARGLRADAVILDLEDAVGAGQKAAARQNAIGAAKSFAPRLTAIRVNAAGTPWHQDDMAAAVAARADAIVLPKVNGPEDIAAARAVAGAIPLWAMIETPRAVLDVDRIAQAGATCLVLGANDLLHALDGRHQPGRANLALAMSLCVLAARAAGIAVLDSVHNQIDDVEGFAAACEQARDFGFDGKTIIHPDQIEPALTAFSPSAPDIEQARRVLAAFDAHPGGGAVALDGRMLEDLDADLARRTLMRAGL